MLDFKALESALEVIGNVGKGEITFAVGNVPVTLRVLTSDEDLAVQQYARESDGDEAEALTMLERFKRATLSYAIVQVGTTDLRGVDYVSTNEKTETGVPVRLPKHVAVRRIVDGWTRTATLALFQKYLSLVQRVDMEAENAIHFDPTDLDAEVKRVEQRLEDLKKEQARAGALKTDSLGQMARVAEADKIASTVLRNVSEQAAGQPSAPTPVVEEPRVEEQASAPTPRQRIIPPTAPPPVRPIEVAATVEPEPFDDGYMVDSLSDSPESVAAENARLQAARMAARNASIASLQAESQNVIPASASRRTPPHRAAANLADALVDSGAASIEAARLSSPTDGLETYQLGTQHLSGRGRTPVPPAHTKIAVDTPPSTQATNPRFKAPR